jgi:MEDS: MEthanogen/methylotroph, DcmR Sensory domain
MDGRRPSAERFLEVVGSLIDDVAGRFPGQTIRVFGEMVDLLWQRGNERGAIALEELWNDLQRTRRFALLCGYRLDIFDVGVQRDSLPEVLRVHTHARIGDSSRLADALDQSLADILGPIGAARTYLDVSDEVPRGSLSRAQAVLGWLAANRPAASKAILERTRSHYRSKRRRAAV